MKGTPLPLIADSCGGVITETMQDVLDRRVSLQQMLLFCTQYRRIGIADFFINGVAGGLFGYLSMSARAFAYYLDGVDDKSKATGKSVPFFDAVACQDKQAMLSIVDHSLRDWNKDSEYEDDFLYQRFLMDRFILGSSEATCRVLLDRYDVVLEGENDIRLDICNALLLHDKKAFDQCIQELIDERKTEIEEDLEYEQMPLDDIVTTTKLWVELLALLRFAEDSGFFVKSNYPLAPDIARKPDPGQLPPPDAWKKPCGLQL